MGDGVDPRAYEKAMEKMKEFVTSMFAGSRPVLTGKPLLTSNNNLVKPLIPKMLRELKNSGLKLEMVHNSPNRLTYRVRNLMHHPDLYRKVSGFITENLAFSSYNECGNILGDYWAGFYGTGMIINISKCSNQIVLDITTKQYD